MALCSEFDQPNEISGVAHYIIDQIPPERLERYAKFSTAFKKGGFRLENIKGIRSQILRLIESKEVIDDQLKSLLAEYSQCSRVLSLLSTETILGHKKELEAFFGAEQVLFAALLDHREKIRTEAIQSLAGKKGETGQGNDDEDTLPWARSRLGELLSPLSTTFGTDGLATTGSGNFAVDNELKELRAKARQLERVEKQLELAQQKERKAEERAAKRENDAEQSENEAGACRQRAEKAEAALSRNIRFAQSQTDAIIQTRLAHEFAAWIGGPRAREIEEAIPKDLFPAPGDSLAKSPGEKTFETLVSQTRKALDDQANADSIGGVRSVIEKRLEVLQDLLDKSNASLSNAIRPTASLIEMRKELEAECRRLRTILHPDATEDCHAAEILAVHINTAPNRQLPEWKHIVDKLATIGLLADGSHRELLEIIRRRYSTLHLQGTREIREEELSETRNILRLGLEGRIPVVLLIDGHNMLYALPSRYVRPQDHHKPSSEAREWLKDDIVRMVAESRACRVILVFDGPERSDTIVSDNVKMIYSGGTGDHRADRVLVDEAKVLVQNGEKVHMLLATNDRDLAAEAGRLGVGNISPVDLIEHFS